MHKYFLGRHLPPGVLFVILLYVLLGYFDAPTFIVQKPHILILGFFALSRLDVRSVTWHYMVLVLDIQGCKAHASCYIKDQCFLRVCPLGLPYNGRLMWNLSRLLGHANDNFITVPVPKSRVMLLASSEDPLLYRCLWSRVSLILR